MMKLNEWLVRAVQSDRRMRVMMTEWLVGEDHTHMALAHSATHSGYTIQWTGIIALGPTQLLSLRTTVRRSTVCFVVFAWVKSRGWARASLLHQVLVDEARLAQFGVQRGRGRCMRGLSEAVDGECVGQRNWHDE
jgi:hypothetical protein